jgi:hypothetical protein
MAEETSDPGIVQANIVEKIDAGAQLVYALYHSGKDAILALPDPAAKALARAQRAYGVGFARGGYIRGADRIDPLKET